MIELFSYSILAFRFWLAAMLIGHGVSATLLGIVGLIAVATTVWAWSIGKPDLTVRGLSVGTGHLVVLLFSPSHEVLPFMVVPFWALVACQLWCKWHLGRRCTVTGPVWVSLIESGPYEIVRHPMTAIELLMAQVFAIQFLSYYNVVVFSLVVASKVYITLAEESFLLGQSVQYSEYCKRVKWRFWPGVW